MQYVADYWIVQFNCLFSHKSRHNHFIRLPDNHWQLHIIIIIIIVPITAQTAKYIKL